MNRWDMSIGRRLALGFGIVLGLLLVVVAGYLIGEQRQQDAAAFLTEQVMPRADAANDLETAYLFQSAGARSYILSGDDAYLADYRKGVSLANDATSRLDRLPETADGAAIYDQIRPLGARFSEAAEKAISLRQQGKVAEAQQFVMTDLTPARDDLVQRVQSFVALQMRLRNETKVEVDRVQQESAEGSLAVAIFALIVSGLLAYSSASSVRRPIHALVAASDSLAGGDYASAIETSSRIAGDDVEATANEVRRLAGRFLAAAQELLARESYLAAQSRLSSFMASTIDAEHLTGGALLEMVGYAKAEVAAIYAFDQEDPVLRRVASYCLGTTAPEAIELGDGIVGEAAASRHTILVKDMPPDLPFSLRLGVDEIPPRWAAAVPLVGHGELAGVLLLAGLHGPDKVAMDYVDQGAKQLAVSLQNSLGHQRVEALAMDLQEKNEELSAQAEELQAQSEEINAQNEELQTQTEEIQAQNEELRAQNDELEAQTDELASRNRRLSEQAARIARLQGIAVRLTQSLSLKEVLDYVVQAASELTGSALASVFLLDDTGENFTVGASVGLDEQQSELGWLSREDSLAGRVLAEGHTVFVEEASNHPEIKFPLLAGMKPVGALIVAPMIARGEPLGVVEVYYVEPRSFSAEEVDMMSALGAFAAVAVNNSRLFETATRQKQAAEAAVKVRDEFISVAAHELKTPVTSLKGFAQLMLRQLERSGAVEPERLSMAMQRIDQQSNRLSRLTEHLLSLSRLQAGAIALAREQVDLSDLLARVISDVQQVHPDRVVELRNAGPASAFVDALRIEQVLINLLDNAVKFSPEESKVEVSLDPSPPGWVTVSVRDWGIGIPEEKRGLIFDRFYQAHPERHYGGMGIGLFVSRQIVEMHGGTISVEQPEVGGSRFVVRLPNDGGTGA